jgi:hypothetical protein
MSDQDGMVSTHADDRQCSMRPVQPTAEDLATARDRWQRQLAEQGATVAWASLAGRLGAVLSMCAAAGPGVREHLVREALAMHQVSGEDPQDDAPAVGLGWMAAARRGLDAHRLASHGATATVCGRSTRTGITGTAADLERRYEPGWCGRCWPDGPPTTPNTAGAEGTEGGEPR